MIELMLAASERRWDLIIAIAFGAFIGWLFGVGMGGR